MYTETYIEYDVRKFLERMPVMIELSHLYKHCVQKVYQRFLPFFIAIEVPTVLLDPLATSILRHPALVILETVICWIVLGYPDLLAVSERHTSAAQAADEPDQPRIRCYKGYA